MASSNNSGVIIRFAIIYFLIVMGFGLVVRKMFQIQHPEKERWLALSDSLRKINKEQEIEPNRGNIYSCDGELMASTVPSYYLYIDFKTPALRKDHGKLFYDNLDSLCYCLSKKFGDKSKSQYKDYLLSGYKQMKRHYPINKIKVSHSSYKEIKLFPLFRKGYKSGLITEKRIKRIKPYGSLAAITIGDLFGEKDKGAKYGLEAAYDYLLRGKPGRAHLERKAGVNLLIADREPENGADITSTLNVDMQDIAEKALRQKLTDLNADLGCVVLMEVKTGQVKACVNLKKEVDGAYRESESIVLRYRLEPGSTQKIPSLMAALEDGVVKPTDTVNCGNGTWQFNEKVLITDHNTGERANGQIQIPQVIIRSSNVGMAKIIYRGYKENPQRFVNTLRRMGVGMPMDVGFPGSVQASIRGPEENPLWGPSDLASMAYGYSVNMPLLYTLAFYNAIANNGEMMQPYFVKQITKNGEALKEFTPKVLKSSICSVNTLNIIKDMMLQVVEDSLHGTGKPVRSKYVRIAGKTGTARYDYKAGVEMRHQVSFCGFFPYENPEYTCIVFIRNPHIGSPSGGTMAGTVFKEIAERVMACHSMLPITKYKQDSLRTKKPQVKNGNFDASKLVLKDLKFSYQDDKNMSPWVNVKMDSSIVQFNKYEFDNKTVPDVNGMGAKDAIFLLEKEGLKVYLIGRGRVSSQSVSPGTTVVKGRTITLLLQ